MYYEFNKRPVQPTFYERQSGLTQQQLELIRDVGDDLASTTVKLYGEHSKQDVDASGSHFELNDLTQPIYQHFADLCKKINEFAYQYDLDGFTENFYYLKYSEPGNHFGYHFDIGNKTPHPRKLSFVVQLSDENEYEGADLEFLLGNDRTIKASRKQGTIITFPSYLLHRVTPLISGTRRSLVLFSGGRHFR